ncbi:MAG TPA: fibronectin type III domain-containing protein [Spirochaetales bacterium]|nr:fibronectin type III domain-containing protein [Spirochaetales bacterium]HRY53773.1 fibronectin type III domain-containing protein [Spirochaetia bacterium]HRZ65951.1 fibronectin type III domain-containing protein [Spirochaetia bacterium]
MRRARRAAFLAASCLASLSLGGCQDLFNAILHSPAPVGVEASDGDYPDRISVSWSAPDLSDESWDGAEVSYYEVEWSWEGGSGSSSHLYSTSYTISSVAEAEEYYVTVAAHLDTGETGSASDSGFAMDAEKLVWASGGSSYTISGERWYETMLQEGFSYRFAFSATGSVAFYPYESLDELHSIGSANAVTWNCDEEGEGSKFYLRVSASGYPATFTASCDYGFGF